MSDEGIDRRQFLTRTAIGAGALVFGHGFWTQALALGATSATTAGPASAGTTTTAGYGPLAAPDANGLRLPAGFRSRVIARAGEPVQGTDYVWHPAPDGGATFATADGGWVYVSNCETAGTGGVGMVRFAADGTIVDARRILDGTNRNCAGGTTPWGTWLSCEEVALGLVWECDPLGVAPAVAHPSMGRFNHEAAVVDPRSGFVYLTEDRSDGGLYRLRPTRKRRLGEGRLEVLTNDAGGGLTWVAVPDPQAATTEVRLQVPNMVRFNRGEGAWFDSGRLYFATTGDNRVWTYEPATNRLEVLYDYMTSSDPILTGVDNVTVSRAGEVFVAEDGGDLQLVLLAGGAVSPFLQVVDQPGSEITGPAFSPDGRRLYVSSQWPGTTYEITGPFRTRRPR